MKNLNSCKRSIKRLWLKVNVNHLVVQCTHQKCHHEYRRDDVGGALPPPRPPAGHEERVNDGHRDGRPEGHRGPQVGRGEVALGEWVGVEPGLLSVYHPHERLEGHVRDVEGGAEGQADRRLRGQARADHEGRVGARKHVSHCQLGDEGGIFKF